jgi:DNA-binding MarR family transcriptional regulator
VNTVSDIAETALPLRLWLQLMKCTKAIENDMAGRFRRRHNQSLSRFDLLSQLYRIEADWVPIGEVAAMVMASSGNITGLVDRMEADGLVTRRANPRDRRSFQVRMTKKGHAAFLEMTGDHAAWAANALSGISDKDKQQLITLLVRVRRAFEV